MKRIDWPDILKGILILFVILGHAFQGISSNINFSDNYDYNTIFFFKNMIYSFHMPAFFIASGLFFYNLEIKLNKKYIVNKTFHLLYPYFLWSFITAVFMEIAGKNTNNQLGIVDF